jgi:hypothetical protein
MAQMENQVAEKHGLALLSQAEHGVELGTRLGGHDRAQKLHIAGWHLHVHHEIGAREREQHSYPPGIKDDRIQIQAFLPASAGSGTVNGYSIRAIDRLADHIGPFVAIEGRAEHLNLQVCLPWGNAAQMGRDAAQDIVDVAVQIFELPIPIEIDEHLRDRHAKSGLVGIVASIGGRVRLDILGRHGRPDENEIVVEIGPVHDLAEDGIEECLCQFRLLVVH